MRLAIALSGLVAALPAFAAPALPEATYACALDGKAFGEISIPAGAGGSVATAKAFGADVKFITMDPDRIEWLGTSMGSLSAAGYRVDKTVIRKDSALEITLLKPDQSGFVAAVCTKA